MLHQSAHANGLLQRASGVFAVHFIDGKPSAKSLQVHHAPKVVRLHDSFFHSAQLHHSGHGEAHHTGAQHRAQNTHQLELPLHADIRPRDDHKSARLVFVHRRSGLLEVGLERDGRPTGHCVLH